jgi:hypothetical protein
MARPYSILVVDDEPVVLEMYASALAAAGHLVLRATDGYQAIRILVERHADLLIADINMPGLGGLDLAAQAKLMCPAMHVLFVSGLGAPSDALKPPPGPLITKPIRPAELLRIIERTMAA